MKRKIPLILLCVLFLGMTGYAGIRMYRIGREYREHRQAYGKLSQYVQLVDSPSAQDHPENTPQSQARDKAEQMTGEDTANWPVVDFQALQEINPDIVAWIYLDGTPINYPVLQGDDNSQYLDRLYDGSYNAAGSIFMDYRNQADLSDRHTFLYGHHMKTDTMFACITEYQDQSFYDAHPACLVMTPEGNYKLEFITGYVTGTNSNAWKMVFSSDEEYAMWLAEAVSKSTFTSTVEATVQDRVVTFSTCSYEFPDARYVLVGILK